MTVERSLSDEGHVDGLLSQFVCTKLPPPLQSFDNAVDSFFGLISRLIKDMLPEPQQFYFFSRSLNIENEYRETYSSLDLILSRSAGIILEPISSNFEIAFFRTFSSSLEVGGSFSVPKRNNRRLIERARNTKYMPGILRRRTDDL